MNNFDGFIENTIISIHKDGSTPMILYSENMINQKTLERLENDLVNFGIEKILQLLPEYCLPTISQNNPNNDPSKIFNETILTWNPNLLLILDKSMKLIDPNGVKSFNQNEFWNMVPDILEEKKSDLQEIFRSDSKLQSLLSKYVGFYGYISYEASRHLELYRTRNDSETIPTSILSFPYNYIIERENDFLYIEFKGHDVKSSKINTNLLFPKTDYISSSLNFETYIDKINSITKYIVAGDIYQANFTQQFVISKDKIQINSRDIYFDLIKKNPVRHSAYLEYIDLNIISISPELFLSVKNGKVLTKPIKGTRPRGHNSEDDQMMINELISSDKDQAELAMIVDLLRNDLGKSAHPGSVEVEKHAAIESYSNVHHLVSSVTADIEPNLQSSWRLFLKAFPGGSITGCPKIRALEIIEELETHPRGVYTGSIGFLALNGNMQFNIAIRTITMTQDAIIFNAGGGIVADSDPVEEYVESLHKATHLASFFGKSFTGNIGWLDGKYVFKGEIDKLNFQNAEKGYFETILVKNSVVQQLNKHWPRLKKGANHYKVDPILPDLEIINTLTKINLGKDARLKLSIIVKSDRTHSLLEIQPYRISTEPKELMVRGDSFEYPKIINEGVKPLEYKNYRESTLNANEKGYWDSILLDNESNILETGRANFYYYTDRWYTSIDNCVHGLTRGVLIQEKKVGLKNIKLNELKDVKSVAISNSLIGIVQISKVVKSDLEVIWKLKSENEKLIDLLLQS